MGSRFYITGIQLGMLKALAETEQIAQILDVLTEIENFQFLGDAKDFERKFKVKG